MTPCDPLNSNYMQSPSLTITPSSPKMLCFIFIGYARGVRPKRASTIFVNYPLSCFYIRDGSLLLKPRRGGKSAHLEVGNYSSHCSGFNSGRKEWTCTNYSSVVCFNSVGFWTQMNTKGLVRKPCSTVYFMKTDIK